MPIDGWFCGTNEDGSKSLEYCRFCFEKGVFTHPEVTMDQMIIATSAFLVRVLKKTDVEARAWADETIPQLKRWKKDIV